METTRFLMAQEIEAISVARGRAEGEARGRAEGEARGRAEGEASGRAEGEARGESRGEARGKNEVKQIIKQHFQGVSSREIADNLDLSVTEVVSTLIEVGLNPN